MADYPTLGDVQREIARQGAAWIADDNPISRLPEAQRLLRLGVYAREGDPTIEVGRMTEPAHAPATPNKFDLRNVGGKNYVTAIRDQGNCGSCVAFGSLAAMEGTFAWQHKKESPKIDLSEAHLYYCYGSKEQVTCNTGWMPARALVHCVTGIVDEPCFPYAAGDQPCKLCKDWQKRLTKISSSTALTGNVSAMKNWISTNGPIVGCFIVYNDFFLYKNGVYKHVTGAQAGGHCVSLIGYDDNQSCWICKNSWGPGWGDNGFFKIGYGECKMEVWQVLGVSI
jgi:C1A family cysteine protease